MIVRSKKTGVLPHRIAPAPLHPQRLKKRGDTQALELAETLACQLRVPPCTGLLQSARRTPPQQGLTAAERKSNLSNAFALNAEVAGLRTLLVDDVMSTGETVRVYCRILLLGGAADVQVAVVGRS